MTTSPPTRLIIRAATFLLRELGDGDWHPSSVLKERALARGIAGRTLKRAARDLVEHERRGWPGETYWRLAAGVKDAPPSKGIVPAADTGALEDALRYIRTPQGFNDSDLGTTLRAKWPNLAEAQVARLVDVAREYAIAARVRGA